MIFRSSCLRLKGEKLFLLLVEEEAGRWLRPTREQRAGQSTGFMAQERTGRQEGTVSGENFSPFGVPTEFLFAQIKAPYN